MKGKKKFLLESSQLHQDKGRYSYLGCNPYGEVKSVGTEVERTIFGGQKSYKVTYYKC